MAVKIRGFGVGHTIHLVGRFAGLWLLVTVAAVLVAAVSSYYMLVSAVGENSARSHAGPLVLQAGLTILAVLALAIFSTHRLAGPWIAVRRALEMVRDGKLDTPLRIRSNDPHLKEVERAFNEMVDSLRGGKPGGAAQA